MTPAHHKSEGLLYHIYLKYSDRYTLDWENSVNPDQIIMKKQSVQGLHHGRIQKVLSEGVQIW